MSRFEGINTRTVMEGKAYAAAKNYKKRERKRVSARPKTRVPDVAEARLINTTQLKFITLKRVFTFYFCFIYYVQIISRDHILQL